MEKKNRGYHILCSLILWVLFPSVTTQLWGSVIQPNKKNLFSILPFPSLLYPPSVFSDWIFLLLYNHNLTIGVKIGSYIVYPWKDGKNLIYRYEFISLCFVTSFSIYLKFPKIHYYDGCSSLPTKREKKKWWGAILDIFRGRQDMSFHVWSVISDIFSCCWGTWGSEWMLMFCRIQINPIWKNSLYYINFGLKNLL